MIFVHLGNISAQDSFNCPPGFFQMIDEEFKVLDVSTGTYTTVGAAGGAINAIGYNVEDDFMYGIVDNQVPGTNPLGGLMRIKQDGTTELVANILNSDGDALNSVAGDFNLAGNLYVRVLGGQSGDTPGTHQQRNLFEIDVSEASGTVMATEISFGGDDFRNLTIADIVFIADHFYAIAGETNQLAVWDMNNLSTSLVNVSGWSYGATSAGSGTLPTGQTFGAGWTDADGKLYLSNNGTAGTVQAAIWEIQGFDTATPTAVWVTDSENTQRNDGGSCPTAINPFVDLTSVCDNDNSDGYICEDGTPCFPLTLPDQIELTTSTVICIPVPFADLADYSITLDGSTASPLTSCDSGDGVNVDVGTLANHSLVVTYLASDCDITIPITPPTSNCAAGDTAPPLSGN